MCIIADEVDDVSSTKIASFHVAYKLENSNEVVPAQLIVYAANIDSQKESNALILPVYNPGNDYKKIIPLDFSEMESFFDDISKIYDRWFPKPMTRSFSYTNGYHSENDSLLEVHTVGDYKFSIMPSKIYFNKLDTKQLNVNPMSKAAIDAHTNDYSFIVYQFFNRGNIQVTPFGYLCQAPSPDSMIIPTIHGHPHSDNGLKLSGFEQINNFTPIENIHSTDFENEAHYDHDIYTLCKNNLTKSLVPEKDVSDMNKIIKKITQDYMNRNIKIYIPKSFIPNKIKISGKKINRNLLLDIHKKYFLCDLVMDKNTLREIY
ncbi:hypothetical protein H012_gp261 [Acanthamoeba polyphaga moumouvirus]|uniref:Uncharacterized protein n=1 Tax=Acanthamoeba polyphaga moumouvirus TaxID=1269028 RepID=L7RCY2_9VIRU|nr:hypothetical protein H012_gp261 [Acanthamoeba polyphaga moumouvirus]AGC02192.1 hypothetical protein Moumou_00670 [Acanthamoeba polyphaga moumouvirus]